MEINANMVEAYEGWTGHELLSGENELVAAINGRLQSPERFGQKRYEYQQRSRTPDWVERRGRSQEPVSMRGARRDESLTQVRSLKGTQPPPAT